MTPMPHVAVIANRIFARPQYLAHEPMAVDGQLYRMAQAELSVALQERGWPLMMDRSVAQPNFLLNGVPIVMEQ